ncbi:esterase OVCA2-like [Rhopilema esculentum]|uniref:esterase OVCA2-like n=1 Tax=Rhopilema esculentum TaxID=499914 RepID=UPI0031DA2F31|eukprot:gene13963-4923_t
MAAEKGKLLRILVIHGYRQSSSLSYEKTGAFRKGLKKLIELVYITAPHKVPDQLQKEDENSEKREEYGWWFSSEDPLSFSSLQTSDVDCGHDESIKLIEDTFKEKGPFDGILGFSQGATVVSHICALSEEPDSPFKFRFAILCAGFKSKSSKHERFYQKQINCPSLHIFGDTDKVIAKERSEELSHLYNNRTVLSHAGGHFLPATSKEKKIYQDFLQGFVASV